MRSLSSPIDRIRAHFPVVVVRSGYGGAIAASRLAMAGQRIYLFVLHDLHVSGKSGLDAEVAATLPPGRRRSRRRDLRADQRWLAGGAA